MCVRDSFCLKKLFENFQIFFFYQNYAFNSTQNDATNHICMTYEPEHKVLIASVSSKSSTRAFGARIQSMDVDED